MRFRQATITSSVTGSGRGPSLPHVRREEFLTAEPPVAHGLDPLVDQRRTLVQADPPRLVILGLRVVKGNQSVDRRLDVKIHQERVVPVDAHDGELDVLQDVQVFFFDVHLDVFPSDTTLEE